jgi:hypothetical protein
MAGVDGGGAVIDAIGGIAEADSAEEPVGDDAGGGPAGDAGGSAAVGFEGVTGSTKEADSSAESACNHDVAAHPSIGLLSALDFDLWEI